MAIEVLFTNKNDENVSFTVYEDDIRRSKKTALKYIFTEAISINKQYELMEKYPVCHIYLWNSKKDPLHFACGVATYGGKGDPLGYQF